MWEIMQPRDAKSQGGVELLYSYFKAILPDMNILANKKKTTIYFFHGNIQPNSTRQTYLSDSIV